MPARGRPTLLVVSRLCIDRVMIFRLSIMLLLRIDRSGGGLPSSSVTVVRRVLAPVPVYRLENRLSVISPLTVDLMCAIMVLVRAAVNFLGVCGNYRLIRVVVLLMATSELANARVTLVRILGPRARGVIALMQCRALANASRV